MAVVSVVVPVYNEEDNVAALIEQIEAVFADWGGYDYECVFVNDGSSDGTRMALERARQANHRIRPVHFAENRGQSAAVVAGMRAAKGEFLVTLDGDLQNDPGDIPKLVRLLQDYDCVCGIRVNRHDPWVRRVSSRVANAVRNAVLHDGMQDSGCGTKGFRRVCVNHAIPFNGVHRFMGAVMRSAGMRVGQCEVAHRARRHGVSKYGISNRLWRGMYDLVGVAWYCKRYTTYRTDEGDDRA